MDSKDNNLIEVKETFWGKFVNNVKAFFSGIFSTQEKPTDEINDNECITEKSSNTDNSTNSIGMKKIEVSDNAQNYDTTENVKQEDSLQGKLEKLIKENEELKITLNDKIAKLKEIRIKELKVTLEIYMIEEMYLKKIKQELLNK